MTISARHAALLAAFAMGCFACDGSSTKPPAPPAEKVVAPQASPTPAAVAPAETPKAVEAPKPAPAPKAATPAKPAPVSAEVKAEKVVVASGKGERHKLGAGQCRVCHRIQYDSWVKSGHARKALDCEGCHGDGSEYAKSSVMRDLAKAKAAGLVFQKAQFCEKCHPTADESFLPKAHAHKPKAEQ